MTAVTICSDFGAQENKICHCFHYFHIYLPWSDRSDAIILVFRMLSVNFSLSSFTFTKRLLGSFSLSAISVVSSAYLRSNGIVMHRCENWTITKAERWRIDAFELWCRRRLLRVPWTASRSNQSRKSTLIFIGRTDAEAETPVLWPPDVKNWPTGKDPDAGKDWRQEEKGTTHSGWNGWMASLTQWMWVWASSGSRCWTGKPGVLQSTGVAKSLS